MSDIWAQFPDAPQAGAATRPGGVDRWAQFPDATPDQVAAYHGSGRPSLPDAGELEKLDTTQKAQDWLGTVPAEHKDAALTAWADTQAAKDVRNGGLSMRASNIVSRLSRSVPGIGSYLDEAQAGLQSAMGGNYDLELAYQRARDRLADQENTPKISTPFGDVYESGLEKAAGAIGGGLALPMARVTSGSGFIPGAVNAGTTAGLYGAAQGFGEGEGADDRLARAAQEGGVAAALGAPLGGVLGRVERSFDPNAPWNVKARQDLADRNAAINAADQEGITLPRAIAGSQLSQDAAGGLSTLPLTGNIINKSVDEAAQQTNQAATRLADRYSGAGTGNTFGTIDPAAAAHSAGNELRDNLANWIANNGKNEFTPMYDAVSAKIAPDMLHPLDATRAALLKLQKDSQAAATPLGDQLQGIFGEALSRPDGLTFNGMKGLRTFVGNKLDDGLLPEGGTIKPGLDRLYGALTNDLENAAKRGGGQEALNAFRDVNARYAQFANERQQIAKIIGASGDISGEKLVSKMMTMAGSKSGADFTALKLASEKASPEAWNELASAVIRKMGAGQGANPGAPGMVTGWSPDRFLTAFGNLSNNGKSVLFGASGPLRKSLDNIAAVSQKFRELRKFQNPSGTGHSAALAEMALGMFLTPLHVLGSMGGTYGVSKFLAQPAGAAAISRRGDALYNLATGKGSEAMLKLTTLNLAKAIADQTGGDAREINDQLQQTFPAQPVATPRRFA